MQKRSLATVLVLLGAFLIIFGFYTSFEIYVKERLGKSYDNLAYFLIKSMQGETLISVPDKFNTVLILKTPEGKVYATQNINLPIDTNMYFHFQKSLDNYTLSLYVKNVSIFEYLEYILTNPMSAGILLSGVILILVGIHNFLSLQTSKIHSMQKHQMPSKLDEKPECEEEIIEKIKALKIAIATTKIIPEESIEEAKRIIDKLLETISRGKQA